MCTRSSAKPFSILERIDVGETKLQQCSLSNLLSPFSILERIDVGETGGGGWGGGRRGNFQYPRTDRRG